MKKFTATILSIVWFMCAAPAYTHWKGNMEVDVIASHGEVLHGIPFSSSGKDRSQFVKKYIEAKKGERYSIVVRNNSSERIGAVIAVDGRNILNGKKSYLGSDEAMYIVEPYSSTTLDGWRTDQDTVHQFYFTEPGDSYSMQTFGDDSAMGVIAVTAFREKERYGYLKERLTRKAPAPAAGAAPRAESKSLQSDEAGTGFGDAKYSPTVKVEFIPEKTAFSRTLIKYEWRETLCRKGILACGHRNNNRLWDDRGYAPYPPGYPAY